VSIDGDNSEPLNRLLVSFKEELSNFETILASTIPATFSLFDILLLLNLSWWLQRWSNLWPLLSYFFLLAGMTVVSCCCCYYCVLLLCVMTARLLTAAAAILVFFLGSLLVPLVPLVLFLFVDFTLGFSAMDLMTGCHYLLPYLFVWATSDWSDVDSCDAFRASRIFSDYPDIRPLFLLPSQENQLTVSALNAADSYSLFACRQFRQLPEVFFSLIRWADSFTTRLCLMPVLCCDSG